MDNHGLLMKFSKIRKKPQQPLTTLTELYSRIARETIHCLDLEKKNQYKAAIQGWKSMTTEILYELNQVDRQYPNFDSYTAEEVSLQTGIRELNEKAMKNLERVQGLYLEGQSNDSNIGKNPSASTSKFRVHTLRDGVYRMRYNRNGSGLGTKSENRSSPSNSSINFAPSKPLPANDEALDPFGDFNAQGNLIDLDDDEETTYSSTTPINQNSSSLDFDVNSYFSDYIDMEEEDLIRLQTLNQLEGMKKDFENMTVNPQPSITHSKSSPVITNPSRTKKSVPQSNPTQRPSIANKSTSDINTSAKSNLQTNAGAKTKIPVARRKTSLTAAAVATSKISKINNQAPPSQPKQRAATVPRSKPVQAHQKQPIRQQQKQVEKVSLSKKPTRSSSPSKPKKPAKLQKDSSPKPTKITNDDKSDASKEDDNEKELLEDEIIDSIRGIDKASAKQIFSEIVVQGDEVHWDDIAGLESAKNSLKEAVVYPFLRPDLFRGLRQPVRGMLLFGPPGTGKTMLARAVATESKSTFFSISASSLTSKYLGESEKLVRALFSIAKKLSPSIIFVDEIDSIMGSRNNDGENESSRRIKNEFLIQWSSLSSAAAGKDNAESTDDRVLVLAATNLPWSIDEAARRRFVRRQYIPLPEPETRKVQLQKLLSHQKHTLTDEDFQALLDLTDGYSGSDITSLAKDAAMGPLRELGDKLLFTETENIRSLGLQDFENSLLYIKPSVSQEGLHRYESWATQFGSSGV